MSGYPPLQELIRAFRAHERRCGDGDWTIGQRIAQVRALARDAEPRHVLELDTLDLEEWLDGRRGRRGRLAPGSRHTYRSHLRAFYGWAQGAGQAKSNPAADLVDPKVPRRLPRPADDAVVAEAMDRADDRMRAWLALGAYEGLRCVEMSRLTREDISIPDMTLRVEGKGDKVRYVPLHPETLEALRAHGLPLSGPVFLRQWRQRDRGTAPLHPQTISRYINLHLPPGTTAHQLRHWFGTHFYREERDILLTAEVMGHANIKTTEGYAAADTTRAAAVVARLSVRRPPAAWDLSALDESGQQLAH